jgi:hypothetical protein
MTHRKNHRMTVWLAFCSALLLAACQTLPAESAAARAKPELAFVDLQSFDRDLSGALASQLPRVNVVFYDKVAPSALPERLQHWMASVEAGGGTVRVVPPPGSVTPKGPFLLITAISAVWNAKRLASAASANNLLRPAREYDVSIVLKADSQEGAVIDQLVFVPRSK